MFFSGVQMLVQEIAPKDSLSRLAKMHLGRLGCVKGAQPYVVPFYFAYDSNYLYGFSTVGQKIDWMRANPLVCVEIDELASASEWISIVILGRYEELPDTPEFRTQREMAYAFLQQRADWWEPGYAKTIVNGVERPLIPVYFRVQIVEITGRRGTADVTRWAENNKQTVP
jgi:nitroimidazol reductase NimA-like FMN-containing flavoprotein (pyridoxamine 5'-phosphate oxidase superfamily)